MALSFARALASVMGLAIASGCCNAIDSGTVFSTNRSKDSNPNSSNMALICCSSGPMWRSINSPACCNVSNEAESVVSVEVEEEQEDEEHETHTTAHEGSHHYVCDYSFRRFLSISFFVVTVAYSSGCMFMSQIWNLPTFKYDVWGSYLKATYKAASCRMIRSSSTRPKKRCFLMLFLCHSWGCICARRFISKRDPGEMFVILVNLFFWSIKYVRHRRTPWNKRHVWLRVALSMNWRLH